MEGQTGGSQPPYLYQSAPWSRTVRRNTYAASTPLSPSSILQSPQFPSPLDFLPNLLPQQSAAYQAQLANYNKLVASGGRASRVSSSPLPVQLANGQFQPAPRKGSSSQDSSNSQRNSARGHGNKKSPVIGKGERSLMTMAESTGKMADKRFDTQKQLPSRSFAQQHHNASISHQSSSVPSTPHQRGRNFLTSSRDPSPNAAPNHSPRSAYSETNSALPSLRPLPPRFAQCKYETAMQFSRRRMAYSIGSERLEKADPDKIKTKLSEEHKEKLTTDMRELYDRLLPTPEGEANRTKFVLKLEKMLNDEWPGHDIKVHMFGSSGNLLCTDESDVDICITTEWKEIENVCKLAELLARNGMEKVICVSTAKVPIVKVWDPVLQLACDMNVNNTLALENTRMIKTYIQIDERVRPLAMIIKHWTKSRIVNDAAFGGTLSSYTWICMIINFLQTRAPPLLPALHQRPHQKLASKDGIKTAFADDVESLKHFGIENKEDSAELLFHFFRFYAHEMDYDKDVISVREGTLISKAAKSWHLATNNMLCVEEPFNVGRNLGNTADDTSFRGLHLELRRAFDLVAEAKLDELCEEYIFPKEEERIWERPPPQPKPVISRTPSQSRSGRGNYKNNNRGNRNAGNIAGRRVSTGAYDNNPANQQYIQMPQQYVSADWIQAQSQMHADLSSQLSQLKAQENNLRNMLYQQSQQYAQMQGQAGFQANRSGGLQASDRNRGTLFENAPMTAPIRPEMYFYPMLQPSTVYGHRSPNIYPTSPHMSPALPEVRKGTHRTPSSSGGVISNNVGSSMRSHSQPASRPMQATNGLQGISLSSHGMNGYLPYGYQQQTNVAQVPNFIAADESGEFRDQKHPVQPSPSPPNPGLPKEYLGYYMNPTQYQPPRKEPMVIPTIPAFGDLGHGRRRPSTDQFPHAIFDRVRRQSRSPSPLEHDRKFANGSVLIAPSGLHTAASNQQIEKEYAPAVVNGSMPVVSGQIPQPPPSTSGSSVSDDNFFDTMSASQDLEQMSGSLNGSAWEQGNPADQGPVLVNNSYYNQTPAIANGSCGESNDTQNSLYGLGITTGNPNGTPPNKSLAPTDSINPAQRLLPNTRSRFKPLGGMSPLDISGTHEIRDDFAHLSPVYEARSPSPTANRKLEYNATHGLRDSVSSTHAYPQKVITDASGDSKPGTLTPHQFVVNSAAKVNGHTRNARSEGGDTIPPANLSASATANTNSWQRPKQKKKVLIKDQQQEQKAAKSATTGLTEALPFKEFERKGG